MISLFLFTKKMQESNPGSKEFPKVSIVIPVYNEEFYLPACLESIFNQDYPKDKLEIIIVDDKSEDKTVEIAKRYPVRLLVSGHHDAESSKKIGLEAATGDYFMYQDADIELPRSDWLQKLVQPLMDDSSLFCSFPPLGAKKGDYSLNRFLSYQKFQFDPMLEYFCPSIDDFVIEEHDGYKVCRISPTKAPLIGNCLIRLDLVREVMKNEEKYLDVDVPILLAESGYDRFAYVPDAHFYHFFVKKLGDLLHKFKGRLNKDYLPKIETRKFKYFSLDNPKGMLKMVVWVVYANLFFPALFRGIYKCFKYKDIACLYEPIVAIALTDYLIYLFLKDSYGREYIFKKALKAFKINLAS
jgi:glycosyltransferase involved in cell wall biosynthesis